MITQKKKDQLVERAVAHRKADRLIQAYGYFEPMSTDEAQDYNRPGRNGEKTDWQAGDWAGCAIGCLAAPVLSQDEYQRLADDGELFSFGQDEALSRLETQFGIPSPLGRMAETVFESLPKDEAIVWPEQFARALPAGPQTLDATTVIDFRDGSTVWSDLMSERSLAPNQESVQNLARMARDELIAWMNGDREQLAA